MAFGAVYSRDLDRRCTAEAIELWDSVQNTPQGIGLSFSDCSADLDSLSLLAEKQQASSVCPPLHATVEYCHHRPQCSRRFPSPDRASVLKYRGFWRRYETRRKRR